MTPFSMAELGAPRDDIPRDHLAVIHGDQSLTYADLDRRADGVASALTQAGVSRGDHVGYLGVNSATSIDVLIGCARVAAVGVHYNWRLAPKELATVLADSTPKLVVCDATFAPLVETAVHDLDSAPLLVVRDDVGDSPLPPTAARFAEWVSSGHSKAPRAVPRADDIVVQLYTSGTTGVPKGARLTHRGFADAMPDTAGFWNLDGDSRMLSVLPMFHIAGIGTAAATLWAGGTLVIADDASPAATLRDIEAHGLTHLVLASVMLQGLVAAPEFAETDLSSLRTVSYGAAPISESVLASVLDRLDCAVMQPYGLTETTGVLTLLSAEDHRAALADGGDPSRLRTCGTARPGVELRVVDPATGRDVEPGVSGEVWARSARIMEGYWNRPEQTAETITPEGWFRTGDVGAIDADGYVELRDRLNDMIISGGENIYPVEVENALQGHPAVAHVAVIGIPDERWGETPVAAVVAEPGSTPDPEEIIGFARNRLAHYKCPTSVYLVDDLPRNATGKVLRKELRNDNSWRTDASTT